MDCYQIELYISFERPLKFTTPSDTVINLVTGAPPKGERRAADLPVTVRLTSERLQVTVDLAHLAVTVGGIAPLDALMDRALDQVSKLSSLIEDDPVASVQLVSSWFDAWAGSWDELKSQYTGAYLAVPPLPDISDVGVLFDVKGTDYKGAVQSGPMGIEQLTQRYSAFESPTGIPERFLFFHYLDMSTNEGDSPVPSLDMHTAIASAVERTRLAADRFVQRFRGA